jgi:hypothetical protein
MTPYYKRISMTVWLVLLVAAAALTPVQQEENIKLRLVRNFGYGGFGKIQGSFTLKIDDPLENLTEVIFYLDGEELGAAVGPPFEVQFHTSDYQSGEHQLSARGWLDDGGQLNAAPITQTFLSGEQAWTETQGILIPLLTGVGLLTLIGMGLPMLLGKNKKFQAGEYGPGGGTVCPRCGLPFSRPTLAPNLLVGKLVRCPHCGKVGVLARASRNKLVEAERKYNEGQKIESSRKGEDDFRKLLEDSRYED